MAKVAKLLVKMRETPNGGCKPYQVKQVIAAIGKLLELQARLEQEQKEGD